MLTGEGLWSRLAGSRKVIASLPFVGPLAVLLLVALVPLLALFRSQLVAAWLLPTPLTDRGTHVDELGFATLSVLGGGVVLAVLASVVVVVLLRRRRKSDAAFFAIAMIGAPLVGRLVKDAYDLPRPPPIAAAADLLINVPEVGVGTAVVLGLCLACLTPWRRQAALAGGVVLAGVAIEFATDRLVPLTRGFGSFPSGHAVGSMAFAFALMLIGGRSIRWRWPVIAVAGLLTLGVGVSRVYLGVHYPADVLAGWCVAVAWTLACRQVWPTLVSRITAGAAGRRVQSEHEDAAKIRKRPPRGPGAVSIVRHPPR